MKAKIGAMLATLLCAASAQATVVTYNFTAAITSVREMVNPFYGVNVDSSTLAGDVIAINHTVHGTFSFDTDTPLLYATNFDWGTARVYEAFTASLNQASFAFDQNSIGLSTATDIGTPHFYHGVDDSTAGTDGLRLSASVANGNAYNYMDLVFRDYDGVASDGGALPAKVPRSLFEVADFEYTYQHFPPGGPIAYLKASGALTSLELVSSVPEPTTYAMLASGLGLLAWRRKRG